MHHWSVQCMCVCVCACMHACVHHVGIVLHSFVSLPHLLLCVTSLCVWVQIVVRRLESGCVNLVWLPCHLHQYAAYVIPATEGESTLECMPAFPSVTTELCHMLT